MMRNGARPEADDRVTHGGAAVGSGARLQSPPASGDISLVLYRLMEIREANAAGSRPKGRWLVDTLQHA